MERTRLGKATLKNLEMMNGAEFTIERSVGAECR